MVQIILASHGEMANGVLDTLSLIYGNCPNVHSVTLKREDSISVKERVIEQIKFFNKDDEIYIVTDIFGGSVNTEMIDLIIENSNITVLSGMNLSLVLGLLTSGHSISKKDLKRIIEESKQQMINCNEIINKNKEGDL